MPTLRVLLANGNKQVMGEDTRQQIGRYTPVEVGPIGDIKGYKGKYIWKEAISNQISYSKIAAEIIPEVKQEISTQT